MVQLSIEQAEAVEALQEALAGASDMDGFLASVVARAAAHVPSGVHVAVALHRADGLPRTATSSPMAAACVEAELGAYEGPSVTSIALGHRVVVVDVEQESRWPTWRAAAVAGGYRTAAAVTRSVREGWAVTLTVLSERPESWDAEALVHTELYVHEVARALDVFLLWADRLELEGQLRATLAGRAVIDQAVGVIMAENRCSAEDARAILESASVNRNVDPRDVAAALIESVTGVPPAAPTEFVARARTSGEVSRSRRR